jgi:dihydrofolate synthase/folylpolyglutamate synthase
VLVSVAEDHRQILGHTLAEITAEKLGLLKRGVPLFCGVREELRAQVFAAAVAAGSPCHFLDELVRWEDTTAGWRLVTRRGVRENLPRQESAALQRNMALAWLCLEELAASGVVRAVSDPAPALRRVFLPGRFQLILTEPDLLVDTAHNTAALTAALDAYLARPCRGRRYVLFGCMQDKEFTSEVGERMRRCAGLVAAPIDLPRSRNQDGLAELLDTWDLAPSEEVTIAADVGAAVARLARILKPEDSVLATGSCFLVAELLYRLGFRDLDATRRLHPAGEVLRSGW